jgi:hypothetical protein
MVLDNPVDRDALQRVRPERGVPTVSRLPSRSVQVAFGAFSSVDTAKGAYHVT